MHLLPADARSLDAAEAAVDLGHLPGDLVFLSFTDADLALAAASGLDGLRVAPLAKLRHPMSVDLYLEKVCRHARVVLVRLLGGVDYWRYGAEELAALARDKGIALAMVPGDGRGDDRLAALSTVPRKALSVLATYWREGGADNAAASLRFLARFGGLDRGDPEPPRGIAKHGVHIEPPCGSAEPLAAIVLYRSALLSGDTEAVDALAAALEARGFAVAALHVVSLKDEDCAAFVEAELARLRPAVILNATAFSAQREAGGTVLDGAGCPVLQVITSGSSEEAWLASTRGLSAADLAMHVALPELDGRLLAGVMSFKAETTNASFTRTVNRPYPSGIDAIADRASAWARLGTTPRGQRRVALILSNYPGGNGGLVHAVGLDAPASALAILRRLAREGYGLGALPADGADLMARLEAATLPLPLPEYQAFLETLSPAVRARLAASWGEPEGPLSVPAARLGNVLVAVQPDRGSALDRRADHHSPDLPPRHAYLAFYAWLRATFDAHAMVHLGTHGTLEWLPGKAAALSPDCFPALALGPVPVLYPFIVNNPGEAAQAKRRLGAVTIGHMTPPLTRSGQSGAAAEIEPLMDEYAAADGLDPRRMRHLRAEILERAAASDLAGECGIRPGAPAEEALARLDAFLCDVKDMQIRDGLHVFGSTPHESEMVALLAGLDGRFIPPGPAGAPSRGRLDVLPTGRNLTTLDPRGVPTRAAAAIGARAAEEVVRRYLQDHGEHPRRIVLDLWGSSTMRTGGDDLGQALALIGAAPVWDATSNRVCGFEVLALARLDRPRVDVTLRISGLFRDVFAGQIVLFDEAVRAVAALDEDDAWNPLAAARRAGEGRPLRIFGAAPSTYGAGVGERIARGAWTERADLGRDYIAASAYAYGVGLEGEVERGAFEARIASADAHLHGQDHREIDILDDMTFAAHQGGFAAALEALGAKAALYHADLSDPDRPRLRSLTEEVARIVHGRAANGDWIAGMMRHGHQGAVEMAKATDALFAFAATAGVVTDAAFERLYEAYIGDAGVRAFLEESNPAAAGAIRDRFAEAVRRGLWKPRRNSVARLLDARCEAAE